MKKSKYIVSFLFSLSLFLTQLLFAQSNLKSDLKKIKDLSTIDGRKPVKKIEPAEYQTLKIQKKLDTRFDYIIGNDEPSSSITLRPSAPNALTPCDNIPYVGPPLTFSSSDDATSTVNLPFNFCFYGINYTSCKVSLNGNVQFSTNSTAYTSTGFPSTAVNMIAPFWTDCYLTSGSSIKIDVYPTRLVISWDSMGYFNNHNNLTNSFQCVLTNGLDPILPPGKNVGFYYKKMMWTTGDVTGTGGFPSAGSQSPATVGVNQGNGIDYYLIGRFGVPGSIYDGPLGNDDGISWLNGKRFYFNTCPPLGSNVEPASTLIGYCDTVKVCGNDSLVIHNAFIGPEIAQTVTVTATAPSLGSSFSFSTLQNGNNTNINMLVNGNTAPNGYHTVTMTAIDDGTPALTSSQTFIVFVDHATPNNINANIVFSPTIGVCPGGSTTAQVVVTGGVPTSYLWNNNDGNASTNYTITPSLDSLVYVTVKSGQCQKTIKNYIRVNPVPVASISGNTSLCSGTNSTTILTATNTLNFSAQGPYIYNWAGFPNPPNGSATTTVSGGTYSVTITNKYNCVSSAAITVVLNQTPQFTVVPSNTVICGNTAVPLSINFGANAPTICALATTGCATSNTSQVGTSAANGSSAVYSPYAGLYESQKNQYLFTAAELTAAGIIAGKIDKLAFKVTSTNGNSTVFENFTIKLKCVAYSTLPNNNMDNTGLVQVFNPTTINATVGWNTYNFIQAYEWDGVSNLLVDVCFFNQNWNGNLSVEYSTTTFVSSKYVNDDGINQCPLNTVDATSTNRPNVRFGNCSTPPASAFSYSWSPALGLSSTSIANPTTNLTSSIVYSVIVTPNAAPSCFNVGTTSLTVVIPTTPTITPVSAMCTNGPTISLSAMPTGGTWSLTAPTSTTGVFTPSLAAVGNNTVTYTYGGVGCIQTTTAIIPVEKYVPSTITGSISPLCNSNAAVNLSTALGTSTLGVGVWTGNGVTGTTFDPAVAGAAVHTLTYSTNSSPTASLCPDASTLNVTVNSLAQPTITACGPYCDNYASQTMTVSPIGGVWSALTTGAIVSTGGSFSPGSSVVGNNTLLYTLTNGPCINTETISINVVHFIPATITGTVGPNCIYDAATNLQTIAQFAGGVWTGNGVTGNTFTPAQAGSGTHLLTYRTDPLPAGLCPDFRTLSILVNDKPEANAIPDVNAGCNPVTVGYATTNYNTGTGVWNFGDGSLPVSALQTSHTYTTPGTYTATFYYTDAIGCKDTTIATSAITVYALPVASFDPSVKETTVVDGQVEFTNHSTVLNNNTYTWDFGGLYSSTKVNESYLFVNSGQYIVTLFATSSDNCVDDTSIVITVNPDVVLYVPNAFTPGSDGLNDVFQIFLPPTGVDYSTFNLVIYDRWGELIYQTNDVTVSWNGKKNNSGNILKQDSYVYKITFQDEKKKYYEKLGHVTLLRK